MKLDWKLLVIIGLSSIVAFGTVMLTQEELSPFPMESFSEDLSSSQIMRLSVVGTLPGTDTPPAATGNIDDVSKALLAEMDSETLLIQDSDNDASVLVADNEEISNLEQFYDENDF
ncbi:MAG: hypothetical protein ABIF89_01825 [bacterium]